MNHAKKVVEHVKLNNNPQKLVGYADNLPKGSKIDLEATGGWLALWLRVSHGHKEKAIQFLMNARLPLSIE